MRDERANGDERSQYVICGQTAKIEVDLWCKSERRIGADGNERSRSALYARTVAIMTGAQTHALRLLLEEALSRYRRHLLQKRQQRQQTRRMGFQRTCQSY